MHPKIVIHLTLDGLTNWRRAERFELYRRIAEIAHESGTEVEINRLTFSKGHPPEDLIDGNLHIIHGGSVQGRGFLNASIAYLPGYWHLNTVGIHADSPARFCEFDATTVQSGAAKRFYSNLRREFSDRRVSRYWQKKNSTALPGGCIAIFLQGRHPYANKQSYMDMHEMIAEVSCASAGRPVVVKPHPLELDYGMKAIKRVGGISAELSVTDANINDLLAAADVAVSVNSSTTFEGFLHGKPSILFGRSDFSSLTSTTRHKHEFGAILEATLAREWDFPKMLYWYFKNHTLAVRSRKFPFQFANLIAESGLDPVDFGLKEFHHV